MRANHATLAGHSFHHEIASAIALGIFGSVDANRGDPQLGWDTDQFPEQRGRECAGMYEIIKAGGFTTGGLNFDAKVRRQSTDKYDLFYGPMEGAEGGGGREVEGGVENGEEGGEARQRREG